ncbi:hypothetical protein FV139_17660 [Parahaliea maris]|uniref:Uncharacterized protein n=1 Tax=Parahaliea maris TaxID=2716870 RepID=A0A5C8ZU52_9GAMM|nr:hypothetical protein [Parahaliea maris]TXS90801.1 hypothetical protein FV139_17660 [Parahaliea maris]
MKLSSTPVKAVCILFLIALCTLSLSGSFDKVADENLDGALAATGAIYATARGINALVSVLQGTELDLPFVTLTIGEVLDPVNDLIERFSTVVLFALGAVAAQKVLLLLVSSEIFNYIFTGIAVLTGLGLISQNSRALTPLVKIFLVAVFVRFALGIVVIANTWVDSVFLQSAEEKHHSAMQVFEGDLRSVKALATQGADYSKARESAQKNIENLKLSIEASKENHRVKVKELGVARSNLEQQLGKEDIACRLSAKTPKTPVLSPSCSGTTKSLFQNQRLHAKEKTNIEEVIDEFEDALKQQRDKLICINKRSQGKACSFLDHIPKPPSTSSIQNKLEGLDNKLDDFTKNAWLLLTSVLLKSVAIPLLFFYALLKCTGLIWRSDFEKSPG